MKKLALTAVILAALAGCAYNPPCTETERNRLVELNDYLVIRGKEVASYVSGEKRIPNTFGSALTEEQLRGAYARSYNRYFDQLQSEAAAFNAKCVPK